MQIAKTSGNGIGCISMHKNSINLIALGNGILWIRKNMMGLFKCKFNILPVHSRNCCYIYMKITRFRDLFFIRWAFIYWRLFILKWASLLTNFSHVTLSWRFGGNAFFLHLWIQLLNVAPDFRFCYWKWFRHKWPSNPSWYFSIYGTVVKIRNLRVNTKFRGYFVESSGTYLGSLFPF